MTALELVTAAPCRRRWPPITAAAVAAACVAVILARSLRATLPQLSRLPAPNGWLLAAAAAAIAASYLCAAVGLRAAAGAPLPLRRTMLAQLAAAVANRIVPGGVGGVAVNARYLNRAGLPVPAAGVAVTAVALANGVAGLLLLLVAGPGALAGLRRLAAHMPWLLAALAAATAVTLIASVLVRRRLPAATRARLRRWYDQSHAAAVALAQSPRRLATLIAGSVGVKAAHVVALLAVLAAFGSHLPMLLVVAVYLGSTAAAALVPTPAGLGSLEAILVAALVAVGGAAAAMLAGVLVFRAVSFWLPIGPGLLAGWALRRRAAL